MNRRDAMHIDVAALRKKLAPLPPVVGQHIVVRVSPWVSVRCSVCGQSSHLPTPESVQSNIRSRQFPKSVDSEHYVKSARGVMTLTLLQAFAAWHQHAEARAA